MFVLCTYGYLITTIILTLKQIDPLFRLSERLAKVINKYHINEPNKYASYSRSIQLESRLNGI